MLWCIIEIDVFGLCPYFLAQSSPNPWNFLNDESDKGVFYYINEVIFGPAHPPAPPHTKVRLVKAVVFPAVMYGCESGL